jgi:hypothetical protein
MFILPKRGIWDSSLSPKKIEKRYMTTTNLNLKTKLARILTTSCYNIPASEYKKKIVFYDFVATSSHNLTSSY